MIFAVISSAKGQKCDCLLFPRDPQSCAAECDRPLASNEHALKDLKLSKKKTGQLAKRYSHTASKPLSARDREDIESRLEDLPTAERQSFLQKYAGSISQVCINSACAGPNNQGPVTNNNYAPQPIVRCEILNSEEPIQRGNQNVFVTTARVQVSGQPEVLEISAEGTAVQDVELRRDGSGSIFNKEIYRTRIGMAVKFRNPSGSYRFSVITADTSPLRIAAACEPVRCFVNP